MESYRACMKPCLGVLCVLVVLAMLSTQLYQPTLDMCGQTSCIAFWISPVSSAPDTRTEILKLDLEHQTRQREQLKQEPSHQQRNLTGHLEQQQLNLTGHLTHQITPDNQLKQWNVSLVKGLMTRARQQSGSGVVYIRIPKCASRTMEVVFQNLGQHNKYRVISSVSGGYRINSRQERKNAALMQKSKGHFILSAHHYFYNVSRLTTYHPVYLTVVREPVSWFQSNYNYHKYHKKFSGKWWNSKPIGQCISNPRCFNYVRATWGPMHFLCGSAPDCRNATMAGAAKTRIDQDFLLVGYMENLANFTKTVQYLLPEYFTGLPQTFARIQAEEKEKFMTPKKDEINDTSLDLLRQKLSREVEVYQYAKQRFDNIYNTMSHMGLVK